MDIKKLDEILKFQCDFCSNCEKRNMCKHVYDHDKCGLLCKAMVKAGILTPVEEMEEDMDNKKENTFHPIDEMVIMFGIENTITFCQMEAWSHRNAAIETGIQKHQELANEYLKYAHELQNIRYTVPDNDYCLLAGDV